MNVTTEEEAKAKICQEAISAQLHDAKVADAIKCIGSACMAWRWESGKGYCGKAGAP